MIAVLDPRAGTKWSPVDLTGRFELPPAPSRNGPETSLKPSIYPLMTPLTEKEETTKPDLDLNRPSIVSSSTVLFLFFG
jgi:hypothetical protein